MKRAVYGWVWCAVLACGVLSSCATREFYLRGAEVPWETHGIQTVDVPAFEASADAWSLANHARLSLVKQLERGTVRVGADAGHARLLGQVKRTSSRVQHSAPRRVLRPAGAAPQTLTQMAEPYVWEVDVHQEVRIRLSLRLVAREGEILWQHDVEESATDTRVAVLPWPGHDVMAPPATALPAIDPSVQRQLDTSALEKTLAAVEPRLSHGYRYRPLP